MIGLPYAEQLTHKRGRVVSALGRYPALEFVYTDPVLAADPIVAYRTRAKLIVGRGGDVGLFARGGGHEVVDIPRCRVLSPALATVATAVRARIKKDEAEGGVLAPLDAQSGGLLRAIDLREVRGGAGHKEGVLVTLVMQRSDALDVERIREGVSDLAKVPEIIGIALNVHAGESPQVLGAETQRLHGVESAFDRVGLSVHLATFGSFVQAHRGQADRVHELIAQALGLRHGLPHPPPSPSLTSPPALSLTGEGAREEESSAPLFREGEWLGVRFSKVPRVLDLYGGSGSISMAMAALGAEVHLVEAFPPAVAQAERAVKEQGLSVTTRCGDVGSVLRELLDAGPRFDAAVINPPRRGTSPQVRELLARLGPDAIVYVSCDPETLARDLDHLARGGYRTSSLKPLDMIPLTDEVESVALLRRAPVVKATLLYEDDEILVALKAPHEPTTPQGEYVGSLFARVRAIPGAEAAVPLHRLDVGTSGGVVFARSPSLAPAWQAALSAATTRRIYLAAVRGISPMKGCVTRDLREEGKSYPARTRYRRLAVMAGHSVLRVVPEQGRTHQVRRHLASVGHPILGDDRYGHHSTNRFFEERNGLDRTFLHCVRLELQRPETGAALVVEAPLPGDLRMVLDRASGPGTLRFLDHKNALGGSSIPPPPDSARGGSSPDFDSRPTSHGPDNITDDDEGLS
jgi:23S rRNA (uracil1939-C5)-methyltransferase